jgi:alpha,alpha-trehalose phosphorylase
VIQHPSFRVEPWALRETELNLDVLEQTESLFALSNGHIGLRGNLDEGEPHGLPGTYLNGFYELRPYQFAESQYGEPEASQTIINVTNGKLFRLLVDDEPFDVRYGQLRKHQRTLDLRAGTLARSAEWTSPAHRTIRVDSLRFVSLTHRALAAFCFTIEPLDGPATVVVQSELVANEALPRGEKDPRSAGVISDALESEDCFSSAASAVLVHRARQSGLRMAAGMDHRVKGTARMQQRVETSRNMARLVVTDRLEPGQKLIVTKLVAYGWSGQRTGRALRDQVSAAISAGWLTGWDGLVSEQRRLLDDFWARADVEIDGDAELQQAVRFALFHLLMASLRGEGRGIPAKGLTGTGYDGHTFWDAEAFLLPVLSYVAPTAGGDALRWRHSTLDTARQRARDLGLRGAAFPWRTIHGEECSGYWPASTAAFHVNADIADAVLRHIAATGDETLEREIGLELLVETARLWRSLGHYDLHGHFRIDGVTGPDEYSAIADNNVYTNLMARRNLEGAASACERHPDRARAFSVGPDEMADWRAAAARMFVPFDHERGVHPQSEGFTQHEAWSFDQTRPDQYPLLLHFPYFDLYRKQVVKQPDLVLAMHRCPREFTGGQLAANFDYYERITVRDSSLSASTEAVMAAAVGCLRLALDYTAESALVDLEDRDNNTRDGLHLASLAGTWIALVAGFGGMRDHDGRLEFTPRLPDGLTRLAFSLGWRGRCLKVELNAHEARYCLQPGEQPFELVHHGETLTVGAEPIARAIPPQRDREPPQQPPGRVPRRRGPG